METYTANALAELFGRDRRVVGRVMARVKPDHKGKSPQWTIKSAFDALLAEAQHRAPKGRLNERELLTRERRRALEIDNAFRNREVFSVEVIKEFICGCYAMFREKCLSLPGQLAADLGDPSLEDPIRRRVYEMMTELATTDKWDKHVSEDEHVSQVHRTKQDEAHPQNYITDSRDRSAVA
jgi:hypothetical protein